MIFYIRSWESEILLSTLSLLTLLSPSVAVVAVKSIDEYKYFVAHELWKGAHGSPASYNLNHNTEVL